MNGIVVEKTRNVINICYQPALSVSLSRITGQFCLTRSINSAGNAGYTYRLFLISVSKCDYYAQSHSTPTSGPPPQVSERAPAHRSYHFRGVKLKSCIKKIHHNFYISKQANVRIKHADTEGASHKKFGTDARVQ